MGLYGGSEERPTRDCLVSAVLYSTHAYPGILAHTPTLTQLATRLPACLPASSYQSLPPLPFPLMFHLAGERSKMFDNQSVTVDCKGHLMGRLCSTVAKQLLCGQKIVRLLLSSRVLSVAAPTQGTSLLFREQYHRTRTFHTS